MTGTKVYFVNIDLNRTWTSNRSPEWRGKDCSHESCRVFLRGMDSTTLATMYRRQGYG
jgi:hypothetical protein